jgi:cell division protein FtsI/penicillin-binding protein 2
MDPVVAAVVRDALLDVVEKGTARRARGAFAGPDGTPLPLGGKTGTGDNRYRVFAPGGRVLEDRVVNRTSTFAFFIDDRYFGVATAYVPGPDAGRYSFTSALPAEIVRQLGPLLAGLGDRPIDELVGDG